MNESTHKCSVCIYLYVCVYTYLHAYTLVCALQISVYTFLVFSTRDVTPLNYNLKTLPGTWHSYKQNQTTLYSVSKVKYSCALVLSSILFRESPTRGHECTQKKKKKKLFHLHSIYQMVFKAQSLKASLNEALPGVRKSSGQATTWPLCSDQSSIVLVLSSVLAA